MRIKAFSSLAGSDFDKFLTAFCKIQDAVRVGIYRTGLSPYPAWIGFICQPTAFPKEFWVIEDNLGRAIGRVGANLLLEHAPGEETSGAIGFFEVDLKHPEATQAGEALLHAAESWLREQRATQVFGPMNFNSWHQYGFCLPESTGLPLFAWEPVHPPDYATLWQNQGYASAFTYESRAAANLESLAEKTKSVYDSLLSEGYSFRAVQPLKSFDEDLRAIYEMSLTGPRDGSPYEAISFEVFRGLNVALSGKPDFTQLAFDKTGVAVGCLTASEEQGHAIFRRALVLPQAMGRGVEEALAHAAASAGLARGLSKSVTALVPIKHLADKKESALWTRRYALFAKSLV